MSSPNNAELAAKLLRSSATFFRAVGQQNPELARQMETTAEACLAVAKQVEHDPLGMMENDTHVMQSASIN